MRRRLFITLLSGAAAAWPLAARAQQARKLPTIGFLGNSTAAATAQNANIFTQRLRELGWVDGRNVAIKYGWAEGNEDRAAKIVADFVHLKVDIIHTTGTEYTFIAKRATSSIPIVFSVAGNPVGSSLV